MQHNCEKQQISVIPLHIFDPAPVVAVSNYGKAPVKDVLVVDLAALFPHLSTGGFTLSRLMTAKSTLRSSRIWLRRWKRIWRKSRWRSRPKILLQSNSSDAVLKRSFDNCGKSEKRRAAVFFVPVPPSFRGESLLFSRELFFCGCKNRNVILC